MCSRFLVAFFMCTTSLKGSAPPCFGISNRSPSALVFWSYVYLTPSCQVTWVLVNLAVHKVARKIESHCVWAPLIYLLFAINSSMHLYPSLTSFHLSDRGSILPVPGQSFHLSSFTQVLLSLTVDSLCSCFIFPFTIHCNLAPNLTRPLKWPLLKSLISSSSWLSPYSVWSPWSTGCCWPHFEVCLAAVLFSCLSGHTIHSSEPEIHTLYSLEACSLVIFTVSLTYSFSFLYPLYVGIVFCHDVLSSSPSLPDIC